MTHLLGTVPTFDLEYSFLPVEGDNEPAETGIVEFEPLGEASVGVWEMRPGIMRNTDEDEIFVVISGKGRVTFLSTGEVVDLGPGVVVRMTEGETSLWEVTETVRKVYVCA